MLEFKFHYTKIANLFHFISNLSEWTSSCRKNYNEIWLEKTGPLSSEEEDALERMRNLLPRYSFGSSFLGIPFITAPDKAVWKEVKDGIEPDDYNDLREIFSIFKPRFEKLWKIEEPKLKDWKDILTKELAKEKHQNLEKNLETFFNQKPRYRNVNIHLLMNAVNLGGGANVGSGRVTLECTALSTDYLPHVLSTLYHEVTHLVFEGNHYRDLLEEFSKSVKDKFSEKHAFFKSRWGDLEMVLGEAVTSSLLPEGYLAQKYFGIDMSCAVEYVLGKNFQKVTKGEGDSFGAYRLFAAAKLFPVVKDYIENKKPVDRVYLQKVWEVFEEFSEKVG